MQPQTTFKSIIGMLDRQQMISLPPPLSLIIFNSKWNNLTGDEKVEESKVTTVILVSGKHYYALDHFRESTDQKNVAIVRVENLCPFPIQELLQEIDKYKYAKSKL